jgi:pimeloyl-ACP methyl ester carboxylesterase
MPVSGPILTAALLTGAMAIAACANLRSSSSPLSSVACPDTAPAGARCSALRVPENYAEPAGRDISLRIVVLPALGTDPAPDPFVFLAGGPGEAATRAAPAFATNALRKTRDLVFADQRGTGGSNDLRCKFYRGEISRGRFEDFLPAAKVPACRSALEPAADLTQYTTAASVADLEAIRGALGYEAINLAGGSYGTRLALEYVRAHAPRVRTLALEGPVPPRMRSPEAFGRVAQRALDGLLDECLADAACSGAFPRINEEAAEVFDRLRRKPASVVLDGSPVTMTREHVAEAVRYMLYSSAQASRVPSVLHAAHRGDFAPIAQFLRQWRRDGTFDGLYLSITCAEDVPFLAPDAAEADDPTFLGGYRVRQQRAACAHWPRGAPPAWRDEPVRADVPALIVSGLLDPVTPAEFGDEVARTLPNSLHVRVPSGAHGLHGLSGLECIEDLKLALVESGRTAGLDASCTSEIRRRGFAIE